MICWACAEPYEGDKCPQCGADKVKPYVKPYAPPVVESIEEPVVEPPKRKVKEK